MPLGTTTALTRGAAPTNSYALWCVVLFACLLILLAPALWNGFPLVFADTGGYLARAFEGTLDIGRAALYGAFLTAGIPLHFWPNLIVQAGLTLWILALVLRAHGHGGRPLLFAGLILALSLLTSLPWYVDQLMPDIFLPLAILALYLLAFRRAALARWERGSLVAFVGAAMALHMTILAVTSVLMLTFALTRLFGSRLLLSRPGLALPIIAWVAGLAIAPLSNLAITGQFAFTPGGTTFLFGRLVQDGIIARYLSERCPDRTLQLCAYRDRLPKTADEWLWNYDSPLHQLGWWRTFEPEANRIIGESLLLYPDAHLATAVKATLAQFVELKTGEGMHARDNWHARAMLTQFAPGTLERFDASRQQHDAFDFTLINRFQVPIALLAIAGLALALMSRMLRPIDPAALAGTVLIALVANAAICGIFSNPNDRYQSRIVWLAPFAVALATLVIFSRAEADHAV